MTMRDESMTDAVLFYSGVALAILGIAGAGAAVVKAMLMKWWDALALVFGL